MSETTFKRWYEKHKSDFNEERRVRYQTDPEYRERVIEYARISRERARTRPKPPKKYWSISEVAEQAGTSPPSIRYWEAKKFIPRPDTGSTVRKYSLHQMQLVTFFFAQIERLKKAIKDKEMPREQYATELQAAANSVKKEWYRGSEDS